MTELTYEEKLELLELLEYKEQLMAENFIDTILPAEGPLSRSNYPKIVEFYTAGSMYKFRLLLAGNRVGKTFAAAFEVVCHLTGIYPPWWTGRRFKFSNNWWVCGVDSKVIIDVLQPLLIGPIGNFGTGMIPKECIDFDSLKEAKKADTSVGIFRVKHISGGFSSVTFKSYESGRETFQSGKANVWLDEEMPHTIYEEASKRTLDTGGEPMILIMTFTPLKGVTDTIKNFFTYKDEAGKDVMRPLTTVGEIKKGHYVVRASLLTDAAHVPQEEKEMELARTPAWAIDSRIHGIPQLGSGAIYPIPWTKVSTKRFEIPKHWKRYAGLDVGGKTAGIWIAIDPGTNVHYIYQEYFREGALPSVHVQGLAIPGLWIPMAIDTAAHGSSQIDGQNLFDIYKDLGLNIHNANKSVEAGLYTCWELFEFDRLKVFSDLGKFQEEYLTYQRDEKG